MAQIELGIEGTRICNRDGYVPARVRTHDGYVPATIRTRNGNVPVITLRNVEASWLAYQYTIGLLLTYDRPDIGIKLACFCLTMLIIVYSHVKLYYGDETDRKSVTIVLLLW